MTNIKNKMVRWKNELKNELAVAESNVEDKQIEVEFLTAKLRIIDVAGETIPHPSRKEFKEVFSSENVLNELNEAQDALISAQLEYDKKKQNIGAIITVIDSMQI